MKKLHTKVVNACFWEHQIQPGACLAFQNSTRGYQDCPLGADKSVLGCIYSGTYLSQILTKSIPSYYHAFHKSCDRHDDLTCVLWETSFPCWYLCDECEMHSVETRPTCPTCSLLHNKEQFGSWERQKKNGGGRKGSLSNLHSRFSGCAPLRYTWYNFSHLPRN